MAGKMRHDFWARRQAYLARKERLVMALAGLTVAFWVVVGGLALVVR